MICSVAGDGMICSVAGGWYDLQCGICVHGWMCSQCILTLAQQMQMWVWHWGVGGGGKPFAMDIMQSFPSPSSPHTLTFCY